MKEMILKHKKLSTLIGVLLLCLLLVAGLVIVDRFVLSRSSLELTEEEAATLIREELGRLPLGVAMTSKLVVDSLEFEVLSVEYGDDKDIRVALSYKTLDVSGMYHENKTDIFSSVWTFYNDEVNSGRKVGATKILSLLNTKVVALFDGREKISGEATVVFYDVGEEKPQLYLSDGTLDSLFGGYITVRADILATKEITVGEEIVSIERNNTIRTGIANCFGLNNYDSAKPDTSTPIRRSWNSFVDDFDKNFIKENRWLYLVKGLGNTLAITGLSLVLGIVIGFLVAVVRVVNDKTGKLGVLSGIVKTYVSIIRGTPIMVQLLIIYFVLLLPMGVDKFLAAVLCFGLNSGAYVSEIIRGGIMSIDGGQLEAGRSLGFGFAPTMVYIVLPQAFKAVLPALCNEFITLLKETSVAFYIGVADLTQGGLKIRSITYSNFMPLVAVALVYLVLVLILTKLVGILERRLRKSER